jgi:DNA-binding MarR family transcriptional regulator
MGFTGIQYALDHYSDAVCLAMSDSLDLTALESLVGYNARRAALTIIGRFTENMARFELSPVDFSVLSVIHHNPGVTSRQLCLALNLLPPNMVVFLRTFEKRHLIKRSPHPTDGRAIGLSLTPEGTALMAEAEAVASVSDNDAVGTLTKAELATLRRLLMKIYQPK